MSDRRFKSANGNREFKVSAAKSARGFLLAGPTGGLYLRIYSDEDKRDFIDHKIRHYDMLIEIKDDGAYFYEDEEGNTWIDHSPEALGLEEIK